MTPSGALAADTAVTGRTSTTGAESSLPESSCHAPRPAISRRTGTIQMVAHLEGPEGRRVRSICRFLSSASMTGLHLTQRGEDLFARRVAGGEESSHTAQDDGESHAGEHDLRGHAETEGHLGEVSVADGGGDAVDRQGQQAA